MHEPPRRRSPRLKEFDYARGWYFVTICTDKRREILGKVVGGDAHIAPHTELSAYGCIADEYIRRIPGIDTYVIMPNHVHMLISVSRDDGAPRSSRPTGLVSRMIAALKRFSNRDAGQKLWQTSFYDHIIRDDADYAARYNYILDNPRRWAEDEYFIP